MAVTQVDLDDEALAEAMRLMGVSTKKETVNGALRDYVARIKRLEAAEKLAARGSGASSRLRLRRMQRPSRRGRQPSSDHIPPRHVRPLAPLP